MISVVIPSYNRKDCILRLLADLLSQQDAEAELIVVDDCSTDDTVDVLRREFPGITLLVNEHNGGPCVSRNLGILAANGEIIVGLDSDVSIPDKRLLAKVAEAFRDDSAATGFAFRIYQSDGLNDDAPRWWHPLPLKSAKDRIFESDYFSGTAYAFRRTSMIAAGLFPEILYMHYEEVELAWRILDQGGTIHYRPDFTVIHHANPVSRRGAIKIFYKPRNQILLAAGCLPFLRALRYALPRAVFQFATACRNRHLSGFGGAMRSVLALLPARLEARKPLGKETLRPLDHLKKQPTKIEPRPQHKTQKPNRLRDIK